jgi:hypothetical protein
MGRISVEMYGIDVLIPILYVVALYEPPAIAFPLTKGDYRGLGIKCIFTENWYNQPTQKRNT